MSVRRTCGRVARTGVRTARRRRPPGQGRAPRGPRRVQTVLQWRPDCQGALVPAQTATLTLVTDELPHWKCFTLLRWGPAPASGPDHLQYAWPSISFW